MMQRATEHDMKECVTAYYNMAVLLIACGRVADACSRYVMSLYYLCLYAHTYAHMHTMCQVTT